MYMSVRKMGQVKKRIWEFRVVEVKEAQEGLEVLVALEQAEVREVLTEAERREWEV
jgi:hypothetical protein